MRWGPGKIAIGAFAGLALPFVALTACGPLGFGCDEEKGECPGQQAVACECEASDFSCACDPRRGAEASVAPTAPSYPNPEVLVSAAIVTKFGVTADTLFWLDDDGGVWRADKDGGSIAAIAAHAGDLAANTHDAFVLHASGVDRFWPDGGATTILSASTLTQIVADDDALYGYGDALVVVPLDGGAPITSAVRPATTATIDDDRVFGQTHAAVFVSLGLDQALSEIVYSFPKDGGAPAQLFTFTGEATAGETLYPIGADESCLYALDLVGTGYTNGSSQTLDCYSPSSGALLATLPSTGAEMVSDGAHIFSVGDGDLLYAIDRSNGAVTPLASLLSTLPLAIAQDDDWIYLGLYGETGSWISRVRKP